MGIGSARALVTFAACTAVAAAACYSVDLSGDGKFNCRDNNHSCPEGFTCINTVCVRGGGPAIDVQPGGDTTVDGDISVVVRDADVGVPDDVPRPDLPPATVCTILAKPQLVADRVHPKGAYGVGLDVPNTQLWVSYSRPSGPISDDASTGYLRHTNLTSPTTFDPEQKLQPQSAPFSDVDAYKGSFIAVYPNKDGALEATAVKPGDAPVVKRLDSRVGVSFVAVTSAVAADSQVVYIAYSAAVAKELYAMSAIRTTLVIRDAAALVDKVGIGSLGIGVSLDIAAETVAKLPAVVVTYFKGRPIGKVFDLVRALRLTGSNWPSKTFVLGATGPLQARVSMAAGAHTVHANGNNGVITYISPTNKELTAMLDDGTTPNTTAFAAIAANKTEQALVFVDSKGALKLATRASSTAAWHKPLVVAQGGLLAETHVVDVSKASDAVRHYAVLWRVKGGTGVSTDSIHAAVVECK